MHELTKSPGAHGGTVSNSRSVMGSHLGKIVKVAGQSGIDVSGYLDVLGLPRKRDEIDQFEIGIDAYNGLVRAIIKNHDVPAFGFRVGREFRVADYGIVGYAILTSGNLGDALNIWCKYQHTIGSDELLDEQFRIDGDNAIISLNSRQRAEYLYRFEIELAVGQWSVAGTVKKPEPMFTFSKVLCSFPKPHYAPIFTRHLNCPVRFDQPVNEIYFPAKELSRKFSLSSKVVAAICEQQCQIALKQLEQKSSLVEQVRRRIIHSPGKPPLLEDVAQDLGMSLRSLRRHLRTEDTSFQQILNDVRMTLADEYLSQTRFSTQKISDLLGYSETANFYRAFRRWFGVTPREYYQRRRSNV